MGRGCIVLLEQGGEGGRWLMESCLGTLFTAQIDTYTPHVTGNRLRFVVLAESQDDMQPGWTTVGIPASRFKWGRIVATTLCKFERAVAGVVIPSIHHTGLVLCGDPNSSNLLRSLISCDVVQFVYTRPSIHHRSPRSNPGPYTLNSQAPSHSSRITLSSPFQPTPPHFPYSHPVPVPVSFSFPSPHSRSSPPSPSLESRLPE